MKLLLTQHLVAEHPSGGLTGIEIHGRLFLGVITGVRVAAGFPIIVHHKHSKQDDGEKLQGQGHDGELQPHVGGVGRHLGLVLLSLADGHTRFLFALYSRAVL